MALLGYLDSVRGGILRGWAYDDERDASPRLRVAVDGRELGEFVGTEFRDDLVSARVGDGRHGFIFALPRDGADAGILTVRFAETGALIGNGERLVARDEIWRSDLLGAALSRGMWQPLTIVLGDDETVVTGWAVPPFAMPMDFAITHNGRPLEFVERGPSLGTAMRFDVPGASGAYAFSCRGPAGAADPHALQSFAFADAQTLLPFNSYHTFYTQRAPREPVPDGPRRKRVGGAEDLASFVVQGCSAYARLELALRDYFGTSFAHAGAILDWGCGCGRVFSHLPPAALPRLTGVDIDPDNVGWCAQAYPAATFRTVGLHPPSGLEAGAYDVVFGVSVFTHLREAGAEAWIGELHRVTRPGAAVLVSVLGDIAWTTTDFPLDTFARFRSCGFYVAGKNVDLDDAPTDASEYYNTFISRRYVYERWSPMFTVLDVIAGGIGNHQDLVVLRRN